MSDRYARHKVRCFEKNVCRRCLKGNDNPTSFVCNSCTEKHRVYQNGRNMRRRNGRAAA